MQTQIESVVACSSKDIVGVNLVPKEAGWLIVTFKNQVVIRSAYQHKNRKSWSLPPRLVVHGPALYNLRAPGQEPMIYMNVGSNREIGIEKTTKC